MGKIKRITAILMAIVLLAAVPVSAKAASLYHLKIEQVDTLLPQMVAYTYLLDASDNIAGEAITKDNVTAAVGGKPVTVEKVERQQDSGHGVCYYYLLDVSSSAAAQFSAMKQAIVNHITSKGKADTIVVITFGSSVDVLVDGTESADEAAAKLNDLRADAYITRLYDGISKAITLAAASQSSIDDRAVIFLATDGADISTGASSADEVMNKLSESDIPIFGFGFKSGSTAKLNAMGEIVRNSDGIMRVIGSNDAAAAVEQAVAYINNAWRIELSTKTNVIAASRQTFALSVDCGGKSYSGSVEALFENWIKDTVSPSIVSAVAADNRITVTFSEPVIGADKADNYTLRLGPSEVNIVKAVYDEERSVSVLTVEKTIGRGTYTLSAPLIKDASVERNALKEGDFQFKVSEGPLTINYIFTEMVYIPIIAGVILIAAIVLIVLLLKRRKKAAALKAAEEAQNKEEPGEVLLDEHVQRESVHLGKIDGIELKLTVVDPKHIERQITTFVSDCYIVGRSKKACDLSVEDTQMSRQHFALTYENEALKIHDLQSTNGTVVNGIKVDKPRTLCSGDVIESGNCKIVVRF